jgi:hypothetical protein
MTPEGLVEFGAQRALFDIPEVRASQGGFLVIELAAFVRLVTPRPRVDLVNRRILVGRKSISFDQIDFARLDVNLGLDGRVLDLRFGATEGVQVVVLLRVGERLVLKGERKRIVEAMLDASRIEMPTSTYDPTGKFGRWNFPTNVTNQIAKSEPGATRRWEQCSARGVAPGSDFAIDLKAC